MVASPASRPFRSHWLCGVPGRQFSAWMLFPGALQVAPVALELTMETRTANKTLLKRADRNTGMLSESPAHYLGNCECKISGPTSRKQRVTVMGVTETLSTT